MPTIKCKTVKCKAIKRKLNQTNNKSKEIRIMSKRRNNKRNKSVKANVKNFCNNKSNKTNVTKSAKNEVVSVTPAVNSTELKVYIDNLTPRNEKFESLCLLSQEDLKEKLYKELDDTHGVYFEDGFLYREGSIPILLVAHMDTVHKELPKEIVYANGTISSPQGIGGDDRCGIYMILEILKKHDCHVLFTEDEEIGCIGTDKFINSILADQLKGKFQYLVELDRKGDKDAVFYECDNPKFEKFITKEFWKTNYGSFTDIVDLSPVLKAASVNFSCGYYKAHSKDEYVVLAEMENNIKEVCALIERTTPEDTYEYIEAKSYFSKKYGSYYGGYYGGYDSWDYDWYDGYGTKKETKRQFTIYYESIGGNTFAEDVLAKNEDEAVGKFMKKNPLLSYSNIVSIVDEEDENGNKDKTKCDICSKMVQSSKTEIVDGHVVCEDCLNEYYEMCDYCGTYTFLEDCYQLKDSSIICPDCYETYYGYYDSEAEKKETEKNYVRV